MANRVRLRSGQVQLAKMRVRPETLVEAGDLVFQHEGYVYPISHWRPSPHGALSECFAGVSHQPSAQGESSDLSIDLSPLAVYEFDVVHGAYEVGDKLRPHTDGLNLSPQCLDIVGEGQGMAIARAVEYRTGANTLRVSLVSALFGN